MSVSRQKQTRDVQSVTKCVLLKRYGFVVSMSNLGNSIWKSFTHVQVGRIVANRILPPAAKVLPTCRWGASPMSVCHLAHLLCQVGSVLLCQKSQLLAHLARFTHLHVGVSANCFIMQQLRIGFAHVQVGVSIGCRLQPIYHPRFTHVQVGRM